VFFFVYRLYIVSSSSFLIFGMFLSSFSASPPRRALTSVPFHSSVPSFSLWSFPFFLSSSFPLTGCPLFSPPADLCHPFRFNAEVGVLFP